MEAGALKQEIQNKIRVRKSRTSRVYKAKIRSHKENEMKQQQRMKVMKDLSKRIRSTCRVNAENRWWVTELLAADCEKAWIHSG